jgi:hypothetical protein
MDNPMGRMSVQERQLEVAIQALNESFQVFPHHPAFTKRLLRPALPERSLLKQGQTAAWWVDELMAKLAQGRRAT